MHGVATCVGCGADVRTRSKHDNIVGNWQRNACVTISGPIVDRTFGSTSRLLLLNVTCPQTCRVAVQAFPDNLGTMRS